jgi:predicted Zn-dependent peptidase
MTIQQSTLSNGLRIITDTVDTVESVAIGVWVDVGTRNEPLADNGISHMVEHMLFNGTKKRSAQEIVREVEDVGGQMNAYTSRENTAYYIHLLKEDVETAFDVLSDMLQHSTFPDKEVEKERKVIAQEIGMTADTPDDLVFDLYQEKAYPGQALGAPILGNTQIIQGMKRQTIIDHVREFYTAKNLVISAAGNLTHEQAITMAEKYFNSLDEGKRHMVEPARYEGGKTLTDKGLEQSHIVLGFQGIRKASPDYYQAVLLSTMMGGGMSSRLFQEIRESRGLAYSVYASHTAYKDDGQFEVYVGTDPEKLQKLLPVLTTEIRKVMQDNIGEDELARAKAQLKSGILMGRESMLARANRQAKHLISFDKTLDIPDLIEKIDRVSAGDIKNMAQKFFSTKPTLAALGPLKNLEGYHALEEKLAA